MEITAPLFWHSRNVTKVLYVQNMCVVRSNQYPINRNTKLKPLSMCNRQLQNSGSNKRANDRLVFLIMGEVDLKLEITRLMYRIPARPDRTPESRVGI